MDQRSAPTDKPTTADVCRTRADEARRCALETSSAHERAEWLELAALWSDLARSMEFTGPVRRHVARLTSQAFATLV